MLYGWLERLKEELIPVTVAVTTEGKEVKIPKFMPMAGYTSSKMKNSASRVPLEKIIGNWKTSEFMSTANILEVDEKSYYVENHKGLPNWFIRRFRPLLETLNNNS